jgi:hypothetical protein
VLNPGVLNHRGPVAGIGYDSNPEFGVNRPVIRTRIRQCGGAPRGDSKGQLRDLRPRAVFGTSTSRATITSVDLIMATASSPR